MKKICSLILALCLVIGLTAPSAEAASGSFSSTQQTVQALGIIVGDGTGNLNLSGDVTRAQFAKMMIAASSYKDTISATAKSSPFKDVKYTHWAASYVQAAVSAGWLTGYTDGTFRPDSSVKLEEAVSAVLKMLGYSSTDFKGSFPEAQLAKYAALGLDDNITKTQGQILTRQDCMYLFYNLMSTKNKSGSYYAATLGYTVNSSGELDYTSLVMNNMNGPFIVEDSSWSSSLPFAASTATVYKNGSLSTVSAVSTYDVYYYNKSMSTLWVYRNQVSGVYSAASPSTSAPTTVTVAGKTYTLATSSASYALSDIGSFGIGDTVTLLLGMNGDVVGVVAPGKTNETKYGFVLSTGTTSYTDSSGVTHSSSVVNMACTDGNTYQYEYSGITISTGDLIMVSFTDGTASVAPLGTLSISGTVDSSASYLGSYLFADDVQIMDSSSYGSFLKIYPSRLAGMYLSAENVRYYALDEDGKISCLILKDATGDIYSYGVLTSATENYGSMSVSSSYKYILNGSTGSFNSSSLAFGCSTGPVLIEFSGSSIVKMRNLSSVTLSSLNSSYGLGGSTQYPLSDGVSVYISSGGSYYLSSVAAVSVSAYTLVAYYDREPSAGGKIRVILAYAK